MDDYKGNGLFSYLKKLAKKTLLKTTYARYPGEKHIRFSENGPHQFSGPGTRLDKRLIPGTEMYKPDSKPVNPIDECSYKHDIAYKRISDALKKGVISQREAYHMVRQADEQALKCYLLYKDKYPISFAQAYAGIKAKTYIDTKLSDLLKTDISVYGGRPVKKKRKSSMYNQFIKENWDTVRGIPSVRMKKLAKKWNKIK